MMFTFIIVVDFDTQICLVTFNLLIIYTFVFLLWCLILAPLRPECLTTSW